LNKNKPPLAPLPKKRGTYKSTKKRMMMDLAYKRRVCMKKIRSIETKNM
jgi:hypothetical protein